MNLWIYDFLESKYTPKLIYYDIPFLVMRPSWPENKNYCFRFIFSWIKKAVNHSDTYSMLFENWTICIFIMMQRQIEAERNRQYSYTIFIIQSCKMRRIRKSSTQDGTVSKKLPASNWQRCEISWQIRLLFLISSITEGISNNMQCRWGLDWSMALRRLPEAPPRSATACISEKSYAETMASW